MSNDDRNTTTKIEQNSLIHHINNILLQYFYIILYDMKQNIINHRLKWDIFGFVHFITFTIDTFKYYIMRGIARKIFLIYRRII